MKWKELFVYFVILLCQYASWGRCDVAPVYVPGRSEDIPIEATILPTVTVRGFLNFRTTVDGTVIVFTPASDNSDLLPSVTENSFPSTQAASLVQTQDKPYFRSPVKVKNSDDHLSNNEDIDPTHTYPNYKNNLQTSRDLFADSAISAEFKTDISPNKISNQETPTLPQYPTGLVTVLGGTLAESGTTTIYETKVIGTYIDGKYAQILHSTSRIIFSPSQDETNFELDSSKSSYTRAAVISTTPQKPYYVSSTAIGKYSRFSSLPMKHFRPSSTIKSLKSTAVRRYPVERRTEEPSILNSPLQSSFRLPESLQQISSIPTKSLERTYLQPSTSVFRKRLRPTTSAILEEENTVSEPPAHRRPPPRFRYVLPRRSTPTVRLNRFKVKLTLRNDNIENSDSPSIDGLDPNLSDDPLISLDPARVIYDKTTITSEVTLHAGKRKSVRTLTIVTTVPRALHPSRDGSLLDLKDAEANYDVLLATPAPFEDNPQVVLTQTYTTTEHMLRTSLMPVLDGTSTTVHTVRESFFILKIITAYKTMPPSDVTIINSENDIALSNEISATDVLQGAIPLSTPAPSLLIKAESQRHQAPLQNELPTDIGNSLVSSLNQNPLAAIYLALQQFNRQMTMYSTITKTLTNVITDTVFSTKVVSFYDGRHTRSRTLSESVSTTEKTITSYSTETIPYLNTQALQLQQLLGSQPLYQPPQVSTITSTYTTTMTTTSYSSKIYTLIYNAISTKYRTVTSSSVYPTVITTSSVTEVTIQPTIAPSSAIMSSPS